MNVCVPTGVGVHPPLDSQLIGLKYAEGNGSQYAVIVLLRYVYANSR